PGAGAAALIEGEQIALVRTMDGVLYAISNFDPFSRAFVIARGIVGDRGGVPKIASPIYKQSFALRTGGCLADPNVRLPVDPVGVVPGRVQGCAVPRRVAWRRAGAPCPCWRSARSRSLRASRSGC